MTDGKAGKRARFTEGNSKTFTITDIVNTFKMSKKGNPEEREVSSEEFMKCDLFRWNEEQCREVSSKSDRDLQLTKSGFLKKLLILEDNLAAAQRNMDPE